MAREVSSGLPLEHQTGCCRVEVALPRRVVTGTNDTIRNPEYIATTASRVTSVEICMQVFDVVEVADNERQLPFGIDANERVRQASKCDNRRDGPRRVNEDHATINAVERRRGEVSIVDDTVRSRSSNAFDTRIEF